MQNNFSHGALALFYGFKDIFEPGIRRYILIPLLINFLIFGVGFYYCADYVWQYLNFFSTSNLPHWLHWMGWLLSIIKFLLVLTVFILMLSVFTILATICATFIAAPFNGLLSEAFSHHLGASLPWRSFITMLRTSVWREIIKFFYYLPWALGVGVIAAILYFLPPFNLCIPIIMYWFSSWMMAIQYSDYAADNHHISFHELLNILRKHRILYLGFGLAVSILSTIPVLNLFVMPAAVLGATRLWHSLASRNA